MKKINILNYVLLGLILILDILYMVFNSSLLLKSITSGIFLTLGTVNLIYTLLIKSTNFKFNLFMLIGLFFAFLGDVLLEIDFAVGAILFAIGHIFYFISYCFLINIKLIDFIYGFGLFILSFAFIMFAPIFNFESQLMKIVCIVYALIISLMVGKALSNYIRQKDLLNLILLIGSSLFFFSDLMLLLNQFANLGRIVGILCLISYYPAQWLLAHSILLSAKQKL